MKPTPRLRITVAMVVFVLVAACSDTPTDSSDAPTTTAFATTTEPPVTTTVPAPTTTIPAPTTTIPAPTTTIPATTTTAAPDAAPPELRGHWATEFAGGGSLLLTLQGTTYKAQAGTDTGTGKISVDGDTIRFYDSNRCLDDPGATYNWVIQDDGTLTFAVAGPEPCSRVGFLDGFIYTLQVALP